MAAQHQLNLRMARHYSGELGLASQTNVVYMADAGAKRLVVHEDQGRPIRCLSALRFA
ncbi:MAG: hypothetical protein ABI439_03995 [Rhodospirillales bacterium]